MKIFNELPEIVNLGSHNQVQYSDYRKRLMPAYIKVWSDAIFCLVMIFFPLLIFLLAMGSYSFVKATVFLIALLWIGFWIHAYTCFFHEAAHYNLHKNKRINDIISNILFTPFTGMLVRDYRISHWEHHKHLGTNQDTEISYKSPLSTREFLKFLTGIYHIKTILKYIKNFDISGSKLSNKRPRSKIFLFTLAWTFLIQITISFFIASKISLEAGVCWLISIFVLYPAFAKVRQTLEHRLLEEIGANSIEQNSATNRIFGSDFFSRHFGSAGFNRHLLHHYDPSISYTNFDELETFFNQTIVREKIDENRTTYLKTFLGMIEW